MGNERNYRESGGFSEYLYYNHPDFQVVEMNGLKAKVILEKGNPDGSHYHLPSYSNTSDMYFKVNKNNEVEQARVYVDRNMSLDFDWGHDHRNNRNGELFRKGVVHVQAYRKDNNGKWCRLSRNARRMTNAEISKYGALIHAFNSNVEF